MATATETKLLTAEDYLKLPDRGRPTELVRGVVIEMNPPGFRHGEVCSRIAHFLSGFVIEQDLGRVVSNDSGIVVDRSPDTVRVADVAFYSYKRVPKGTSPIGYPSALPEIVFEVVSPGNTRGEIRAKVGEYLKAGVSVVCIADPEFQTVNVEYPERPTLLVQGDDALIFDELPGFALPVRRLFE
jgi:Uma2 family endonuclease